MKIADILGSKGSEVITIDQGAIIHEAIQKLVEHNIGSLLVVDKAGKPLGIITERDILRESAQRSDTLKKTRVKAIMTTDLIIGVPEDDIEYTMGIMTKNRIRHLPIMNDDEVIGLISIGDVVKAHLAEREYDNRYLKQYMFGPQAP